MDQHQGHFDGLTRFFSGLRSRRYVLRGLAAAGLGLGVARLPERAQANKQRKRKPKSKKGLCQKDGSPCRKSGKNCKRQYCLLRAPFTIEARWSNPNRDHDTIMFVPNEAGSSVPAPYIDFDCTPAISGCERNEYPFICVSQDATGPGDEVTTVRQLLPGTYEYWVELYNETPAGEVSVVLKDRNGRVLRQWANPANPSAKQVGWHVFDVDGNDGRVTSVDELIGASLPEGAHDPYTYVCPD